MAEIIATKNLRDSDVGITDLSSEITVTSEALKTLQLSESEQSSVEVFSDGDLKFVENDEGYTLVGRGENTLNHITLTQYLGKPITEIASSAFCGDSALLSITIPTSVKYIGYAAFEGSALTEVTFEETDKMLIFAKKPSNWTQPFVYYETDTSNNAWPGDAMDCWDVNENIYCFAIPRTATGLIFNSGDELYKTEKYGYFNQYPSNIYYEIKASKVPSDECTHYATIDYYAPKDFDLYDRLTIGESAFENCTGLTAINIPERVVSIGKYTFKNCASCNSLLFAETSGLANIGIGAFQGCASLVDVSLPEGLETLGNQAFLDCTSLATIYIPSTVRTIGTHSLSACSNLTNVAFATNGAHFSISTRNLTIGTYAFSYCASLETMNIPARVNIIGGNAFEECGSLTQVYFAQPYTWFVSTSSNSNTTDLTLIDPAGIDTTSNAPNALNAAALLRYSNGDYPYGEIPTYGNYYWYRRTQMVPPVISLTGSILTMTDPLGIAESFWIYVNGGKRCQVFPASSGSSAGSAASIDETETTSEE